VDDVEQELQVLLRKEQPCLIVIDYAETRTKDVIQLVRIALNSGRQMKLRLVLLARDGGDWWNNLADGAKDEPALVAVLRSYTTCTNEYMAKENIAQEVRPAIFREALAAFAARKQLEHASIETPDLSAEFFNHILFIHLSALASLHGRTIAKANDLLIEA